MVKLNLKIRPHFNLSLPVANLKTFKQVLFKHPLSAVITRHHSLVLGFVLLFVFGFYLVSLLVLLMCTMM